MDRKNFIKACAFSCVSASVLSALLHSCAGSSKIVQATLDKDGLTVPIDSFHIKKESGLSYKKYVIASHDDLQYPICIFRIRDTEYRALLMQCTHQGAELQVFGEKLVCPAHGAEFDKEGVPQSPPAEKSLRTFKTEIQNQQLKIVLR